MIILIQASILVDCSGQQVQLNVSVTYSRYKLYIHTQQKHFNLVHQSYYGNCIILVLDVRANRRILQH